MAMRFPSIGLLAACLLAGGCATPSEDYPSLAIREGERVTGTLEPEPAPAYVAPPNAPATLERLDELTAAVRAAHAQFLDAAPQARNAVNNARGANVGAEDWSVAQVAVADLESIRSDAMIALADIDRIYVRELVEGNEIARIAAAREEVIELVEDENRLIAAMLAAIGG